MTCKIVPDMTYNVFGGTLSLAQSINSNWRQVWFEWVAGKTV